MGSLFTPPSWGKSKNCQKLLHFQVAGNWRWKSSLRVASRRQIMAWMDPQSVGSHQRPEESDDRLKGSRVGMKTDWQVMRTCNLFDSSWRFRGVNLIGWAIASRGSPPYDLPPLYAGNDNKKFPKLCGWYFSNSLSSTPPFHLPVKILSNRSFCARFRSFQNY